jgi:HEAT repeat protein
MPRRARLASGNLQRLARPAWGTFAAVIALVCGTGAARAQAQPPGPPELASIPVLLRALKHDDPTARLLGAIAIGDLAQAARSDYVDPQRTQAIVDALRPAGAELAALVNDPDLRVRRAAIITLGVLRPANTVAVPAWTEALKADQAQVRLAVMTAIGPYVNRAREFGRFIRPGEIVPPLEGLLTDVHAVLPLLRTGLGDSDPLVVAGAIQAVEDVAQALDRLPRFGTGEGAVPLDTVRTQLLRIAEGIKELVPALVAGLPSRPAPVQEAAARTLEDLARLRDQRVEGPRGAAPAPDPLRPPLIRGKLVQPQFETENRDIDRTLREGLQAALPVATELLARGNDSVQIATLGFLEVLGGDARSVADAVVAALDDDDRFVRWAAARTLGQLATVDNHAAIAGLTALLRDEDVDVRGVACQTLAQFGPHAAAAAPELGRLLAATIDPELQVHVLRALTAIGPAGKEAVPVLLPALGASEVRVRREVANLLGMFGPDAREAVPALTRAMQDPELEVRQAAARALTNILKP